MKFKLPVSLEIPTLLLAAVLARLPYLLSDDLIIDGDEGIVGLMALHLSQGKALPLYFYGQNYGFSLIEILPIATALQLGNTSDLMIKIPTLALWLTGSVFFYQAVKGVTSARRGIALVTALLLVATPFWIEWSMKARGGYVSSFLLSSVFIWLLFRRRNQQGWLISGIFGMLLVMIYECQPLWLPGLLCLIAFRLSQSRLKVTIPALLTGLLLGAALFALLKSGNPDFWKPTVFSLKADLLGNLPDLPFNVVRTFSGSDELAMESLSRPVALFGWIFCVYTLFWVLNVPYYVFRGDFKSPGLYIGLAIAGTLSYSVFLSPYFPRYLLPLSGFVLIGLAFHLGSIKNLNAALMVPGILVISGMVAAMRENYFKMRAEKERRSQR